MKRHILFLILMLMLFCTRLSAQDGQRQLENALSLEQEQRYDEAINAYNVLIQSNPDEERLLQAKMRLGRIYLEEKKEAGKARPYFADGIKSLKYPDVAAFSTVYSGRARLMAAVSERDFEAALGEFDSVIRTYPDSQAVVEALISAGAILEMQHKYDQARMNYLLIVSQFPDSSKVSPAFLQLGRLMGKQGNISQALQAYQSLQVRFEGREPASIAEDEASLLYRLFLLKKRSAVIFKQSIESEKSNSFRLDDPYMMYWASGKPTILNKEKDLIFTAAGEYYRFVKGSLVAENPPPLHLFYLKDTKRQQFDEVTAVAVNQYGYMVVATRGPNGLFRVNRETGESSPFTSEEMKANKIGVDSEGRFYVLNESHTELTIFDARGKTVAAIQPMSVGNKELVDFALDRFDNIYLLDREGQFVVVGGLNQTPDLKLTTIHRQQVVEPSKSSEAKPMKDLRALTVSPNGSVFVVSKQYLASFK